MPMTVLGGQFYSISRSGMLLFQQGAITSVLGGVTLDLVSAPIEPGEYILEINTTLGGVEIFLPRYVQFTLEDSSLLGGRNVHEGPEAWEIIKRKLQHEIPLPDQPPDFAFAPSTPERAVRIHFVINSTLGGIEVYRL